MEGRLLQTIDACPHKGKKGRTFKIFGNVEVMRHNDITKGDMEVFGY
jgi:hypothetical protein